MIEALRIGTLLSLASGPPAPERDWDVVSVESEASSDDLGVAVAAGGLVDPRPPELEVAMAEEALALTTEGAADAEPGAVARGARPMRDGGSQALVMHATRRTVHRANCKFVRRMVPGARVFLAAAPAAEWRRCQFCRPG